MGLSTIGKIKLLLKFNKVYNLIEKVGTMNFLRSKKGKALIIGIVTTILVNLVGLPEESVAKITDALTVLMCTYLGSQGIADGLSKGHTSSEEGSAN